MKLLPAETRLRIAIADLVDMPVIDKNRGDDGDEFRPGDNVRDERTSLVKIDKVLGPRRWLVAYPSVLDRSEQEVVACSLHRADLVRCEESEQWDPASFLIERCGHGPRVEPGRSGNLRI